MLLEAFFVLGVYVVNVFQHLVVELVYFIFEKFTQLPTRSVFLVLVLNFAALYPVQKIRQTPDATCKHVR